MKNIIGLKNWKESKRYCDQNLSTIEKARKDIKKRGFFATCNTTSIYTGMDCRGDLDKTGNPSWMGIDCKPNDFMYCHLNWNKYDNIYQSGSAMDNEYIYSLAKMLQKMGYKTEVKKLPDRHFFIEQLLKNYACVINIPGHYCCGIAYDKKTNELIYHNPWPGDPRNKNNGRFERMNALTMSLESEYQVKYALAFGGK